MTAESKSTEFVQASLSLVVSTDIPQTSESLIPDSEPSTGTDIYTLYTAEDRQALEDLRTEWDRKDSQGLPTDWIQRQIDAIESRYRPQPDYDGDNGQGPIFPRKTNDNVNKSYGKKNEKKNRPSTFWHPSDKSSHMRGLSEYGRSKS